jgi:hypothetical protein
MNLKPYFDELQGSSQIGKKLKALRFLAPLIEDPTVVKAICDTAVTTQDHHLRTMIIDALQKNAAAANSRFADIACHSTDPRLRKWALVNLSLMGCGDASDAVILGLTDQDASVRNAAALSTGLYHDAAVHSALEDYFEKYRFDLIVSFVYGGIQIIRDTVQGAKKDGLVKRSVDTGQSELRMDSGR